VHHSFLNVCARGQSSELVACILLLKTNGLGYRNLSPPPIQRDWDGTPDEFNEWENEIAYMTRVDQKREDMMKKNWSEGKAAAGHT